MKPWSWVLLLVFLSIVISTAVAFFSQPITDGASRWDRLKQALRTTMSTINRVEVLIALFYYSIQLAHLNTF